MQTLIKIDILFKKQKKKKKKKTQHASMSYLDNIGCYKMRVYSSLEPKIQKGKKLNVIVHTSRSQQQG